MNPFETGQVTPRGVRLQDSSADERITRVREFTADQCRAALSIPDLQKTVRVAIERRLRKLGEAR